MEPSESEQGSETDTEQRRKQRRESWPINKGLPSTSDIAAASGAQNVAPPSGTTTSKQRTSFEQSGATTIPRITVQEERAVTSRQYLRPPPSDIREGFPSLRVRPDIPRSCPTLVVP